MPIEERKREVDMLALYPRQEEKTFYTTTDGTEFDNKKEAIEYDDLWEAITDFKKIFSEEKSNFRPGNHSLNDVVAPIDLGPYKVLDCFWIKAMTKNDEKALESFIKKAYNITTAVSLSKEDANKSIGGNWIYCIAVEPSDKRRKSGLLWISLKVIKKKLAVINNNLPDNKNRVECVSSNDYLDLDLDLD